MTINDCKPKTAHR